MRGAELTLERVKESQKAAPVHVSRLSDFVSSDQLKELHDRNAKGSVRRKAFDMVDAYVAEIMARFGYEAYKDWNMGIIPDSKMRRLVAAERAREMALINNMETVITLGSIAGATSKKAKEPINRAIQQVRNNEKITKGQA